MKKAEGKVERKAGKGAGKQTGKRIEKAKNVQVHGTQIRSDIGKYPHLLRVSESILDLVGYTPLVRLQRIGKGYGIYAKLEYFNPSGSIKDRMAMHMVDVAERRGELKPGMTILEATTGNTGIALALIAAVRGYRFIAVMPASQSIERKHLMQALGAKVVLTPADEGPAGAINTANELVEKHGYFKPGQFDNPDNPAAHHQTGWEILTQLNGKVDAFISAAGTGGTLMGVSQYLKKTGCCARIVCVEPARCAVLSGCKNPKPHVIQGVGEGFIPEIIGRDRHLIDQLVKVTDRDAIETTKRLIREEGLLVGISSGANIWAALKVAKELGPGKNIVTVLSDSTQRYFSTGLCDIEGCD
jgi:cysteine synthase A